MDVATILRDPGVRARITAAGGDADVSTSTAALADRVVGVAVPAIGASGTSEARIGARMYASRARQGSGVNRQRTEDVDAPPGELIVRTLVSFARQGLDSTAAVGRATRCTLQARIPPDLRTFGGALEVDVEPGPTAVRVRARTFIPSQLVDWGRSRSILRRLFDDLHGAGDPS